MGSSLICSRSLVLLPLLLLRGAVLLFASTTPQFTHLIPSMHHNNTPRLGGESAAAGVLISEKESSPLLGFSSRSRRDLGLALSFLKPKPSLSLAFAFLPLFAPYLPCVALSRMCVRDV